MSIKSMSSEARMILMMTRLRQTYDEENETQSKYITELNKTRDQIKQEYENLKNGVDMYEDEDTRESESTEQKGDERSAKETEKPFDDSFEHVINEVVKVQVSNRPKQESVVGKPVEKEHADTEAKFQESDKEVPVMKKEKVPIFSDWNPPNNVSKKVDCSWDPQHPLYKEIQSGFKSQSKLPDTRRLQMELKRLNKKMFSTGNIPPNNVYLQEAKRRYPSGFHNEKVSPDNKIKKSKTSSSSPSTTGTESPYSRPVVSDLRSYHYKKLQRTKRNHVQNKNKRLNDNIDSEIVSGANTSPGPVRKRPSRRKYVKTISEIADSDEDRLDRDKKSVQEYQHYVENKSDLPDIKNGVRNVSKPRHGSKIMNDSSDKVPKELPRLHFNATSTPKEGHSRRTFQKVEQTTENGEDEHSALDNDANGYDGDESDMNSKSSTMTKTGSTMPSSTKSGDVPIGNAVNIVKSRQNFYNKNNVEQENQREHRVLKLFRDLQKIRKNSESNDGIHGSDVTLLHHEEQTSRFLLMKYDSPQVDSLMERRKDLALRRFLHAPLHYEICSKGPGLHASHKRKEKALDMLQQQVSARIQGGHKVK